MFPIYAFIYFLICGALGLMLHFKMLEILKKKGFKVNYIFYNPLQFFRLWDIMREEENLSIKRKYQVLLWGQIILIPTYLIGMFVIIGLIY